MQDKQRAMDLLSQNKSGIAALGNTLFATPELGYKERKTAGILRTFLEGCGIPCRQDLSLTGFAATLGSGDYHIALVADLDAVSISKNGVSIPYHSCGHHIQMAVCAWVMKALWDSGLLDTLDGRVSFIGTPAEEFIDLDYRRGLIAEGGVRFCSGKQDMIANGLFDDVDCVLNLHVTANQNVKMDLGSSLAGFSVKKVTFHGLGAHSGAAAYEGKNALHAAGLFLNACTFLWEQFPPEAGIQLHPIITNGGVSMNVIPEAAVVESYVRANTNEFLFSLQEKFDTAARHCAAALGMRCTIADTTGYMPLRQSAAINEVVLQNMLRLYPAAQIAQSAVCGASGDVGDLSFLLPTAQIGFSGFAGRIHSDHFAVTDEQLAYVDTAQVLLGAIFDLLAHPEYRVRNLNYAHDKAFYMENWLKTTPSGQTKTKE